ncbi:MAG TPA: NAD(P)H-binding protein, partial [Acidimicrobiales bacterium]|nr:NAD(P)H-binding protein [Acidimicrobiales bacterium]
MRVAITGASGFIGSHVLTELQGHGHDVTALVRDDDQAVAITTGGAEATVVDLYDRASVMDALAGTDGMVHTASPGDATSADLDSAVVDAVTGAYEGTGKVYI